MALFWFTYYILGVIFVFSVILAIDGTLPKLPKLPRLFSTPEERYITETIKGALAMGPYGWTRCHTGWSLKAGNFRIVRYRVSDYKEVFSYHFEVDGVRVPLRWRDRMAITRAFKKWDKASEKNKAIEELRSTATRLEGHIEKHRDELAELDEAVVREILRRREGWRN